MGCRTMAAIAVLLAASSASASKPGPAQAKGALDSAGCAKCHDSSISAEKPRALAVYDLAEEDWPARLSDARLPKLLTRLKSASAADQGVVRDFVAAELKRRAGAAKVKPPRRRTVTGDTAR